MTALEEDFEESQLVSKYVTLSLVTLGAIFMGLGLYFDKAFMIGALLCLVFSKILHNLRFEVKIDNKNNRLEYALYPFHKEDRAILLSSIVKMEKLSPKSLGILGLKIKNTPRGSFYYLGGKSLVCLKTSEGKTLYIGSHKMDEMMAALNFNRTQVEKM